MRHPIFKANREGMLGEGDDEQEICGKRTEDVIKSRSGDWGIFCALSLVGTTLNKSV